MAALYPASLALRLTQAGTETSNRASEFLFLGLALVAGGVLASPGPRPRARPRATGGRLLVTALVGVLFTGGVVIGWPPASRVPGPPADRGGHRARSSRTTSRRRAGRRGTCPRGSRMVADRANGLLMSAYAAAGPADRGRPRPAVRARSSPRRGGAPPRIA